MSDRSAFAGNHPVVPLPFDPTTLRGLSDRLIRSHHENNYAGAVKNLNRVEAELAQLTQDTPPFVVAALKERELTFRNSAILHEHYFANLGGNGQPGGAIETCLARGYGSFARWEDLDYGAAAARYVDAFMQNINWDEVNRRLEQAEKASATLRPLS